MSMGKKAARLEELLDGGEAHARRVMIGTKEELLPLFHLIYADGTSTVVGTAWKNDEEKQSMVSMVKHAMLKGDVIRYSFVCEAWSVFVPAGEAFEGRPSEAPNRVEGVFVTACDLRREIVRGLRTMRDTDGVCVDLVRDNYEGGKISGTMSGMLKP